MTKMDQNNPKMGLLGQIWILGLFNLIHAIYAVLSTYMLYINKLYVPHIPKMGQNGPFSIQNDQKTQNGQKWIFRPFLNKRGFF